MSDLIRQLSVFLENAPGRLAGFTRALGDAGIDMRALMVADTAEYGVARLLVDEPARAKQVLEEAGFGVRVVDVIGVEVPDRPGGLADVLEMLGAQGVNVEYAYCFVAPRGACAIDILRVDDPDRAEQVLGAGGIRVAEPRDLYEPDRS